MFGSRSGTVALGTISNMRIENNVPVCDVECSPFVSFSSVQFMSWNGMSCLPNESITADDTTRAVLLFPESGSTRAVRATPIVIGVLKWPAENSVETLRDPRFVSGTNAEVTAWVRDAGVSITQQGSDKALAATARGPEVVDAINTLVGLLNDYHQALRELSVAAAAPSATLEALEVRKQALGGSWARSGDECLADALQVQ